VRAAVARALAGGGEGWSAQEGPAQASGRLHAICVGLSGGCDSVVLLHALAAIAPHAGVRLGAVHVHHGLSPNADRWASFCEALCRRLQIPFDVARVAIDRASGLGIEAAAREQRYRVFRAQACDAIALAHHQDDQAETVLLQLLRGAGLRGLSAMAGAAAAAGSKPAPQPSIIRPLLTVSRATIEGYARQHRLDWIDDESNADIAFDRNFIRHQVLPLLETRYPAARATLARSSRLLGEAAGLIESVALDDLACARGDCADSVSLDALAAIGEARARELLRAWLRGHGVSMPAERRLAEALRQAMSAAPNRAVAIRFEALTLRRYRDRLYLTTAAPANPAIAVAQWNRRHRMNLPALGGTLVAVPASGAGIALRRLRGHPLDIAPRASTGGAAVRIALGDPPKRRTLKNLWQETAVPPWQREAWPLLWLDGELACIPGVAVASDFAARPGEPGRVFQWLPVSSAGTLQASDTCRSPP
jgi:tRNA(Ile)-lysidine synthase